MKTSNTSIFAAALFLSILVGSIWGKAPIQFCASFEDENHYRLLLLDDSASVSTSSKESNVPDSVYCENPFWVHSLWPSFEGDKRTNFKRYNYDLGDPKILEEQCKTNSAQDSHKKATTPKLEWNFSAIDASLYNRTSAEKFLKKFYNKTFTGYWMADLACTCPHFEMAHQSRTFKAKLVGKCDSSFKKEHRVIPEDYKPQPDTTNCVEEKPIKRINNPDWIPCYRHHWQGGCKIDNYASKKPFPVHGKVSGIDESLECYHIDEKFYLNFATNVPHQKSKYSTCYTDSTNCSYSDSAPELEQPFFYCKNFNLVDGGCEPEFHGIDFVVDETLHYEGWNRNGMHYFFRQKTENEFDDFFDNILFKHPSLRESYKEVLPEGFTENDISRLGNEAAQKTTGMFFYKGATKVHYEKFNKPKFKSLKDAMQHCKEQWANNKF